jgi:uncharacterized membrane protein YebE (DUF533 family)
MNAQQILDLFLNTGKEYVDKGIDIAQDKLDIPEDPEARKAMLSTAGKGALAAGAIALLLGTGAGRKLTGATLKLGSLAAIGGLAYQTFQEWQKQNSGEIEVAGDPINELSEDAKEKRSLVLLKAMIAAAQVDGHIDDSERTKIVEQIKALGLQSDTAQSIEDELTRPVDIKTLAASADSPEMAAEMYLVSRVVLDVDQVQERLFLNELASALGLETDLVYSLEAKLA